MDEGMRSPRTTRGEWWSLVGGVVLAMGFWGSSGCAGYANGHLTLKSQIHPETVLAGGFTSSIYSLDDANNLTLLLLDGTIEDPAQAVVIRMFWKPRAGRTPIDPTATNATVLYTIFAGDNRREVGIYSGAGFVYPLDQAGQETFSIDVWHATLRLTDRSHAFRDLLRGAILEGHLTATRDDVAVERALKCLRILVTERMGYPMWVNAADGRSSAGVRG